MFALFPEIGNLKHPSCSVWSTEATPTERGKEMEAKFNPWDDGEYTLDGHLVQEDDLAFYSDNEAFMDGIDCE
jgi:hypothetical protein